MIKKIFSTLFFISITFYIYAQTPKQNGTGHDVNYVSELRIMSMPPTHNVDSLKRQNKVEVSFKISRPELTSKVHIIVKNKATTAVISEKDIAIKIIGGIYKYSEKGRNYELRQNHGVTLFDIGDLEYNQITTEAYTVDHNGKKQK